MNTHLVMVENRGTAYGTTGCEKRYHRIFKAYKTRREANQIVRFKNARSQGCYYWAVSKKVST